MLWVDSTNNLIKLRNSSNNAWITLFTTAGGLDVDAASNFNEDVTFTGASANVTWDKSADDFIFNDNAKAVFGTSSDGLAIYHNGSNSYIQDTGTGNLHLTSNGTAVSIDKGTSENMAVFNVDGAVELYWNNSKKLETKSYGIQIPGGVHLNSDSEKLYIGADSDLQIYHDGSNSYINDAGTGGLKILTGGLQVKNAADDSYMAFFGSTGATELYYNGSKKLETTSYGAKVTGQADVRANVAGDYAFQVYNDGASTNRYGIFISCGQDSPSSSNNYLVGFADGDGSTLGYIKFTSSGIVYDTFTAAHPCIIPDADNPSDDSMAYPYGTLLETIEVINTDKGLKYKVQKTQTANSKKVLGAYGGSMNGGPNGDTNLHDAYVVGDGHILVNNAGGNIEVGDGICSSATAGIGQKATANPSMIIGIAQEAVTFTGSETKLVAVQYGLQQFIPWT
jgi:hypothetical protein